MTRELNQLGLMTCKLCAPHSKNLLGIAWGTGHKVEDVDLTSKFPWSWADLALMGHAGPSLINEGPTSQPTGLKGLVDNGLMPQDTPCRVLLCSCPNEAEPSLNRGESSIDHDWPQMPDWSGIWGTWRAGQSLELWPFLLSCSAVEGHISVEPTSIHNNSQVVLTTLKHSIHMRP